MGRKKSKTSAVQTAFSFEGTINANNRQNIVPPKEHAVGTAVILDFLSCHRHCKVLKHFRKVFRRVKILSMLEVSFQSYSSFSRI